MSRTSFYNFKKGKTYSLEVKYNHPIHEIGLEFHSNMKRFGAFDENDLSNSKFFISIDVSFINAGKGIKNRHSKSDKWFDATEYPSITFNSSKFSKLTDVTFVSKFIALIAKHQM